MNTEVVFPRCQEAIELDEVMDRESRAGRGMITVEFRRTIWSERADVRPFMPGATIAEIVSHFDRPLEFEFFGGVYLKRDRLDPGMVVAREHWHRVRPKPGTFLFVSLIPQGGGGGGGDSGKQTFAIVASIALIALSAGTMSFLSPMIGALGAQLAATGVMVGGSLAIQTLTKPTAGREAAVSTGGGASSSGPTIGSAGISQNAISAWQQVPCVTGYMRVSPPLLARPFTTIEETDQVVHLICGLAGQYDISDILINETPIDDFPSGMIEYETREGWEDDDNLSLITQSVFEENIGQEMSRHRLEANQATLVDPVASSYPRPHFMRSARRTSSFRILLSFPSGIGAFADNDDKLVAFRIRMRPIVNGTPGAWVNMPEMHFEHSTRTPFRREIWFVFGTQDEDAYATETLTAPYTPSSPQSEFKRFYYTNSEWTADSYFSYGTPTAIWTNVAHIHGDLDKCKVFLDSSEFPVGQYEFEMTRSLMTATGSFTRTAYPGGLFTDNGSGAITSQKDYSNSIVIQSYSSFRSEYPINRRGLALIAISARNLQIQSVSALFKSYVDGVVTQNPAKLFKHIATGSLNAQPLDVARLESLTDWETHCTDNNLACNRVIESGSVEDALMITAQCGDAILRRSDKWGVVIDKDRSAEDAVGLVTPQIMTQPLTVTIEYLTAARAIVPSFHDENHNFSVTELAQPIYDDGVSAGEETLTEAVAFDGLTSEALVRRAAKRNLRAKRLRNKRYSFGLHLRHIDFKKGSKLMLAHDVLLNHYANGRLRSYSTEGGNLISVTLNNAISEVPVIDSDNIFAVENVFLLKNIFDIDAGYAIGMQIELGDATVETIPLMAVDGATLFVEGAVAAPAGLKAGLLVAVGPTGRESRPIIVSNIMPRNDFHAMIEAVDLAPEIYEGL